MSIQEAALYGDLVLALCDHAATRLSDERWRREFEGLQQPNSSPGAC